MNIATYYATLKLKPDPKSVAEADRWLKSIEKRFGGGSGGGFLGNLFRFNQKALDMKVKQAFDRASLNSVLHINRFHINQTALNYNLNSAIIRATQSLAPITVNTRVRATASGTGAARTPSSSPTNNRTSYSGHGAVSGIRAAGTIAGFTAGGFGLSALNTKLQKLEMLPVSMEAVTGDKAKADQQLAFLNRLGHEVGSTRMELAPDYTKFFASAAGTPLEAHAQSGFRSLTRYGKVMGLDQEEMKGSFKAVTQMVNKQQIMAEELKGQLAERLPAAVRLMAEAVTGGDTKKLMAMMKDGQLDPNTALPKFFMLLESKAAGGWGKYTQTTRYQQNMAGVNFEDSLALFGKSGGNDAFFRMWQTIQQTLPKLDPIVKALAKSFSVLADGLEHSANILVMFSDGMAKFNTLSPEVQKGFGLMGAAAVLFGTQLGRAFLPLTLMFGLLDDLATYRKGGKSLIGEALGGDIGSGASLLGVGGVLTTLMFGGKDKPANPKGGLIAGLSRIPKVGWLAAGAAGAVGLDTLDGYGQDLREQNDAKKSQKLNSMQAIMLQASNPQAQMYGPAGPLMEVQTLNIYSPTSDPEDHAYLFMKEINSSISQFPTK